MKMRRGDVMTESHRGTSEAYVPRCTKMTVQMTGPNAAGTAKIDAAVRMYLLRRGDDEDEASVYRAGKTVCISRRQDCLPRVRVANHSLHSFTELVCQKFEAIQYLPNTKISSRIFR